MSVRPALKRWLLVLLCAGALAAQTRRAARLLEASRIVRVVEAVSGAMMARGGVPPPLLAHNVELLRRAERLDPSRSVIRLVRGSQLRMLHRPEEAVAAYQAALELEPRAEIYFNLARAWRELGRESEAAAAQETAIRLHPQLRRWAAREAASRGVSPPPRQ